MRALDISHALQGKDLQDMYMHNIIAHYMYMYIYILFNYVYLYYMYLHVYLLRTYENMCFHEIFTRMFTFGKEHMMWLTHT